MIETKAKYGLSTKKIKTRAKITVTRVQNPKKKTDPGNRLYSIKRMLPEGLLSISPLIKGKKLSALLMTKEILKRFFSRLPLKS